MVRVRVVDAVDDPGQEVGHLGAAVLADLPDQVLLLAVKKIRLYLGALPDFVKGSI